MQDLKRSYSSAKIGNPEKDRGRCGLVEKGTVITAYVVARRIHGDELVFPQACNPQGYGGLNDTELYPTEAYAASAILREEKEHEFVAVVDVVYKGTAKGYTEKPRMAQRRTASTRGRKPIV